MREKAKRLKSNAGGQSYGQDLLNGPVFSTLLAFSLPFILSTVLQTLYTTVDTIVVGQFLGQNGLSAVSNGSQLMQMMYLFCINFSTAGQIMISQAHGAGKDEEVQIYIDALLILEIVVAILVGGFCVVGGGWMLTLLHVPEESFVQARYYVIICGAGMLFTSFYNMFSAILRGLGDSFHPFLFVLISCIINIFLDLLFIGVFHWDVAGAAFATVIGQMISVVFSFVYINRHGDKFPFVMRWKNLAVKRKNIFRIVRLGIPLAIQGVAVHISFLFVSSLVNALGVTVSAAFGAAQKLRNLPGMFTQGMGMGCAAMIGQNLGARRTDRVKKVVNSGLLISAIVVVAFGVVFALFPVMSFRMFTQDEAVLSYARMCVLTILIELPGQIAMQTCCSLVNAQGFVQFSVILGFIDAFVGRVFLCWLLGMHLGLGAFGLFLGYGLGTYFTAIPVSVYYVSGLWKKRSALV